MAYDKYWIDDYIKKLRMRYKTISKEDVKRISRLFPTSSLRQYFMSESVKLDAARNLNLSFSKKEVDDILKAETVVAREAPKNDTPPRKARPGKVWMKVLLGKGKTMWVERNIDGPDYKSSVASKNKIGKDCVLSTSIEVGTDSYFQNNFENKMRRYASGGLTRYQKGGNIKREWFGKKGKR